MRDSRLRDSLEGSIPNLIGKLFRRMARVHNRALKGFEISAVQAHVLATLWLNGATTMGELQNRLALGSSTLTGAIDRMEKQSLVTRALVPGDRRAFRLEPATWPEKKKTALLETLKETEDACFGTLTQVERKELRRLLAKALISLERIDHDDE